ncbi:MAG: hypothetical protein P8Y25_04030 [Chromatiaceae bacterium]|jgi:hypothetical protein
MRFVGYLFLLALIAFGVWPYYQAFRLDQALGKDASHIWMRLEHNSWRMTDIIL